MSEMFKRLECRFDRDVYDRIRSLAADAEISVNQLLSGVARWAVENPEVVQVVRSYQVKVVECGCWMCSATGVRLTWWSIPEQTNSANMVALCDECEVVLCDELCLPF